MKTDFVELNSFTKVYSKGKNSIVGCEGINFKAYRGKVTGLLGLNGAGKSTMLKALSGVHYPTSGTVKVFGHEENDYIRSVCGVVPEFPSSEASFTVMESLYLEAELHGVNPEDAKKLVEKAIKLFDLDAVRYQKVLTLSKGYLQRTVFAKALTFEPELLILDEFSTGLDPAQILSMKKAIKSLAKDKAVILSTHHIDEAVSLCDYVYIIHHGKVKAEGTIEEIVKLSGKKNLEQAFMYFTETQGEEE